MEYFPVILQSKNNSNKIQKDITRKKKKNHTLITIMNTQENYKSK